MPTMRVNESTCFSEHVGVSVSNLIPCFLWTRHMGARFGAGVAFVALTAERERLFPSPSSSEPDSSSDDEVLLRRGRRFGGDSALRVVALAPRALFFLAWWRAWAWIGLGLALVLGLLLLRRSLRGGGGERPRGGGARRRSSQGRLTFWLGDRERSSRGRLAFGLGRLRSSRGRRTSIPCLGGRARYASGMQGRNGRSLNSSRKGLLRGRSSRGRLAFRAGPSSAESWDSILGATRAAAAAARAAFARGARGRYSLSISDG
jgi:hypothetical protein